jgi:PKD repeat protein
MSYSFLTIPFHSDFNFDPEGAFNIQFYIKVPTGSTLSSWVFNRISGSTVRWGLQFDASALSYTFINSTGSQVYSSSLVLNTWQKLKISYNAGRWAFYINDILVPPDGSYQDSKVIYNGDSFSINNPGTADFDIDEISVCGPFKKPTSDFLCTQIGATNQIIYTDTTADYPTRWEWSFGSDAFPPIATGQGPHTVEYSSRGNKIVTLTTYNYVGSNSITKVCTVLAF